MGDSHASTIGVPHVEGKLRLRFDRNTGLRQRVHHALALGRGDSKREEVHRPARNGRLVGARGLQHQNGVASREPNGPIRPNLALSQAKHLAIEVA